MTRLIIVSGSGRCGSSMLMQMLDKAGIKCAGSYPDFEDPRGMQELDLDWLAGYEGAVKILDPHRYLPAIRLVDAKAIRLDRDRKQQARSWCKVSRDVVGRKPNREDALRVAKLLKQARKPGVQKLVDVTGSVPLFLTYESVVQHPRVNGEKIARFLGVDLDLGTMASQVISRPTTCLDGLLERDMVRMGREAVEEMIRQQRMLRAAG